MTTKSTGSQPDQTAIEILLHEYDRMCLEVRTLETNNEKTIAFGLSVVTAAFTVGLAQHVHQIFFVIPLAIVGVFFYAVLLYTYIFSMCGYKQHLEDRLNAVAHDRILLWEPLIRERQTDNLMRPVLVAIYLLIAGILIFLSIQNIVMTYGGVSGFFLLLAIVVLLGLLLKAVRRMLTMHKRIYAKAAQLYADKDARDPLTVPDLIRN